MKAASRAAGWLLVKQWVSKGVPGGVPEGPGRPGEGPFSDSLLLTSCGQCSHVLNGLSHLHTALFFIAYSEYS